MSDEVRVISADLDGAELRRAKNKNSFYLRCDGKEDNDEINEAIQGAGKQLWGLPNGAWEQIFGGTQ